MRINLSSETLIETDDAIGYVIVCTEVCSIRSPERPDTIVPEQIVAIKNIRINMVIMVVFVVAVVTVSLPGARVPS